MDAMVRKATLDDIPEIRRMALEAFPDTYKDILSRDQIDFMLDMMYSEQSLTRQMTIENNVFYIFDGAGYVSFRYVGTFGDGESLFHLEKLYVLPGFQGKGVGRELFNTVVREVRSLSSDKARIELNVNRHNKAVSFYEHIGMHRDRQGDFPIGKGYFMNDYIMAIEVA